MLRKADILAALAGSASSEELGFERDDEGIPLLGSNAVCRCAACGAETLFQMVYRRVWWDPVWRCRACVHYDAVAAAHSLGGRRAAAELLEQLLGPVPTRS